MKQLAALLAALPLFGALTLSSSKALADTVVTGVPNQVISFNNSSDFFPYYHGTVVLNGAYYYWGGFVCQTYTYQPSNVSILSEALINKRTLNIYYKTSSANYRCVTGIALN